MSEPLLERATRALRTTVDTGPEQLERGLERLQRSQRSRRAPRQLVRSMTWALAATLAGAGAWAQATGRVHWFESAPEPAPVPAETPPARTQLRQPPAPAPTETAIEDTAEPPPAPSIEAEVEAIVAPAPPPPPQHAPARRARAPVAVPTPAPEAPASETATDRADELYREAHAVHFARADYAAALVAWDRYLAAAPPGHRWAVEARYNRAIALYRLGQTQAARRALEPFAEGEYGSYRRADARRLLQALPRSE